MLTKNDGVLARQLVREVTGNEHSKPGSQFENRDEPTLCARVVDGGSHPVLKGSHAT